MSCCGKNRKCGGVGRVFAGLLFLAAAAVVTLSVFDIWTIPVLAGLGIFWLVFVLLLIVCAISSLFKLEWFTVFLPLAGIATILNYQTDYLSLSGKDIGAVWVIAVLVSIGFSILFHRKNDIGIKFYTPKGFKEVIDSEDGGEVTVNASFSSVIKHITSDRFKKAVINAKFSGVKVYFDGAKLAKDGKAEIVVNGSFSGIELYIPKEWSIVNDTNSNLSGLSEKNSSHPDKDKDVVLSGDLNLSGIEIIYV